MIRISCPECGTAYKLPDGAVPDGGRAVQCRRCGASWTAAAAGPSGGDPAADLFDEPRDEGPETPAPRLALAAPESDLAAPLGGPVIDASAETFRRTRQRAEVRRRTPAHAASSGRSALLGSPRVAAAALAAVLVLAAGTIFLRDTVVRAVPDLAGLYALIGLEVNLRGLQFADLRSYREQEQSTPVLVVEGLVQSVSERERAVPVIRLALTGDTPRELYAWSIQPARTSLEPGGAFEFRARLPMPPEAASRVNVRFIDGSDAAPGR